MIQLLFHAGAAPVTMNRTASGASLPAATWMLAARLNANSSLSFSNSALHQAKAKAKKGRGNQCEVRWGQVKQAKGKSVGLFPRGRSAGGSARGISGVMRASERTTPFTVK